MNNSACLHWVLYLDQRKKMDRNWPLYLTQNEVTWIHSVRRENYCTVYLSWSNLQWLTGKGLEQQSICYTVWLQSHTFPHATERQHERHETNKDLAAPSSNPLNSGASTPFICSSADPNMAEIVSLSVTRWSNLVAVTAGGGWGRTTCVSRRSQS